MASVKKRGESYLISVSMGYDSSGKQIVKTKTYKPAPGMTERQIQKEVERQKVLFAEQVKQGFAADNRQTFEQYAAYVLELKERAGLKHSTLQRYKELLVRILPEIGYMKLSDIRPAHLNELYKNLSKQGMRENKDKCRLKVDFTDTLHQAGYTYEEFAKRSGVSMGTLAACRQHKNLLIGNAQRIADALQTPLDDLFERLENQNPLSSKTVTEYHRLIHTILKQAEKEMIVPYNAADKADPPKLKRRQVNYFQIEQVQEILSALQQEPLKWRVITTMLIYTGCRRGELLGLKWDKVDFEHREIRIENNLLYSKERGIYEDTPKTAESIRTVTIPAQVMELLSQLREDQRREMFLSGDRWTNTGFVFTRDNGQPMHPDSVTDWLDKFAKRHDLPHINPHAFRHTMASILISQGTDVITTSKRLGHAKVSTTTDIYSHMLQDADSKAADSIEQALLKKA